MQTALFDTECYPNYWLLKFRVIDGPLFSFSIANDDSFSSQYRSIIGSLFANYRTISFNGIGYDVAMITGALAGYTTSQLKWLNDQIIVHKVKPWQLSLPEWAPADHIDLMEVAPGTGSLKQYAARIHSRSLQDLPYDPDTVLDPEQMTNVDQYCENDLDDLEDLFNALQSQISLREKLSDRYGVDLRSKSDAQLAETVLKRRCEQVLGRRLYKPDIDWNMRFRYDAPDYIAFANPDLSNALHLAKNTIFQLSANGKILLPDSLEGFTIRLGASTYKIGIGGLHSQEQKIAHFSDENHVLIDSDVEAYYPSLILNSGKYPLALGEAFLQEFGNIKDERVAAKKQQKLLEKSGDTSSNQYNEALVGNEGGKVMINGTFGKTGSHYSILFAPNMTIQTTLNGQFSLLMLIEWHEHYGIPIVSANTDGIVIKCPRHLLETSRALIAEWEWRTGLTMEQVEYRAIYSRDVNNYFAVKTDGDVKRKGEYAKSGLIAKKNPDVEICSDAVATFLVDGVPLEYTIASCRDIRKFLTVQKVAGGGVKLWGDGPKKGTLVRDMLATLESSGWMKVGRLWQRGMEVCAASEAYRRCFKAQRPEYLGKVVRWYYSTEAPGPIVYASNGNTVGNSYGAHPCMTLPDEFPINVDYQWYIDKANSILHDIGLR